MKAFKNRTVAVLLAAVLVIGFTLISASAALKNDIKNVTNGFYTGALYDGEKTAEVPDSSQSIYKQLTVITAKVDNICAVAAANDVESEALKNASYYLKSNLSSMHEFVCSIYWSYDELCQALTEIKPKLNKAELTDAEREAISEDLLAISEAQKVISESGYNESVRRYKSSMNAFEEFVADICGIYGPEFFS